MGIVIWGRNTPIDRVIGLLLGPVLVIIGACLVVDVFGPRSIDTRIIGLVFVISGVAVAVPPGKIQRVLGLMFGCLTLVLLNWVAFGPEEWQFERELREFYGRALDIAMAVLVVVLNASVTFLIIRRLRKRGDGI